MFTLSLPLSGIDTEEFIEWCGSNLVEGDVGHIGHVRRIGKNAVINDTPYIRFDAASDSERVLFRLRWQI